MLQITDPKNGARISLGSLASGSIFYASFLTTNFTGHAWGTIDGPSCNAPGKAYTANSVSPLAMNLDYCPSILGEHTVAVELRADDDSIFIDPATGAPVRSAISVLLQLEAARRPAAQGRVPPI